MNDIIIRPATASDLPVLLQFEQAIINAERPFDDTLIPSTFNYYDLAAMIENSDVQVIVAEVNNELVGSGHVRIRAGDHYNNFERYAFLGFMYVVPAYRGKGINQMIVDALTAWSRKKGLDEVRLLVYNNNEPAIKAYEKAGFKKLLIEMRMSFDNNKS